MLPMQGSPLHSMILQAIVRHLNPGGYGVPSPVARPPIVPRPPMYQPPFHPGILSGSYGGQDQPALHPGPLSSGGTQDQPAVRAPGGIVAPNPFLVPPPPPPPGFVHGLGGLYR